MRVVIDTNVLIQLFGALSPFAPLRKALQSGELGWILSTPILLEYEEVVIRYAGRSQWQKIARIIDLISELHGTVLRIAPNFHFSVITADHDDDIFADAAICASADFVVTEDRHFAALRNAGYKPQPITPEEFIRLLHLRSI